MVSISPPLAEMFKGPKEFPDEVFSSNVNRINQSRMRNVSSSNKNTHILGILFA